MSQESPPDISIQRKEIMREISRDIYNAYRNRKRINAIWTDSGYLIPEDTEAAERDAQNIATSSNVKRVQFEPYVKEPHRVFVNNSHDYHTLVELALKRLNPDMPHEEFIRERDKMLKHEYEHHVPGLGIDSLTMKYSVAFYQDMVTGYNLLTGGLIKEGSVSVPEFKAITEGPEELSDTDQIISNALNKIKTSE